MAAGQDWERTVAELVTAHPGLYFDLSYWTEAARLGHGDPARVRRMMAALLEAEPLLEERMMYGSDWSMIGRVARHGEYLNRLGTVLEELVSAPPVFRAVMGRNALRFLGLHRKGSQRTRLDAFFGSHPVYRRAVAEAERR